MSDLSFLEKPKLEKLLGMGSGYVLDFSNRTFEEFVAESVGLNIFDTTYDYASGSKANRLRAFWNIEPNHVVGKLVADLLEYSRPPSKEDSDPLFGECSRIAARLRQGAPVPDIETVDPELHGRSFEALQRSVRRAIDANEPETALDRLHTYVLKYMRFVCENHGIATPRDKPLHSLVGEYVKCLKAQGRIESAMTERILKSSISTMEAFNRVRNEQSLAHDNPVLNYNESLLIFSHVVGAIRFVQSLERDVETKEEDSHEPVEYEIPSEARLTNL